ncbi:unnamed protein product [Malus baccata var. baccata]
MFAVEPHGLSGRLCVLWKDGSQVTLLKSEEFVIEMKIWDDILNKQWRLFAIYASTDEKKRNDQWKRLGKRIEQEPECCLLIGDFNDILCNEEKEGGNYRPASSMRDFREFVANNELMDLGYEGYPFTWRNNRESLPIQQRLDRGLATMGWNNMYPDTTIGHLVLEGSDHAMLVLSTEKIHVRRGMMFSYDARWSKLDECRDIVAQEWDDHPGGSHAFRICEKLKLLRKRLKSCRPNQIRDVEVCMETRVSSEDNRDLVAPITDEEIKEAVFQIPSDRAPGPIALCNVIYKILAKVITNRLKRIMPKVIGDNQSAFVAGKQIQDNILVVHEILHSLNHQSKDMQKGMAIKLDMAKAYDRVEWDFLLSMMSKLGFAPFFCNRVKECISTVSFSILINGSPTGYIQPQRGLRQGDPLSPFLFLICTEGFSSLIKNGMECGLLHGYRFTPNGTPITHLFFADDSVLFGNATVEEAKGVVDIVNTYARGSGQEINLSKSSIFFGTSTSKRIKKRIGNTLGIMHKDGFGKYLGLQADFGLSKKAVFAEIRDKMEARLAGWSEQFLSQAGKEVLIKAVAMALPNFAMSCFKLPIGVCRDMEKAVRSYWWRGYSQKRGCHWASWDRLMKQKSAGGKGRNTSWGWKGIFESRTVLQHGVRWRVGDGESINIRKDPWLPTPSTFLAKPLDNLEEIKVRDLIDPISKSWKEGVITEGFNRDEARTILSIPLSKSGCLDRLVWHYTVNGDYSVKTGYGVAMNLMENGALGKKGRGASSVLRKNNLSWKRIWNLQCEFSHRFWFGSSLHINSYELVGGDFLESWDKICTSTKNLDKAEEILQEVAFGLWRLWKNRNDVVFNGAHRQHLEVMMLWRKNIYEYREAMSLSLKSEDQLTSKNLKSKQSPQLHWTKPKFGTIKVNTDAAWCSSSLRTGVGWVGRDFAGLLQAAGGTGSGFCHSAAAAEASAIRFALLACIEHGFHDIIIESDASSVIKMIKKEVLVDFSIECILGDIEVLVHKLRNVSFAFVPREGNRVAHSVAKYVFKEGRSFSWDCIGPDFLFNFLAKDVNLSIRL